MKAYEKYKNTTIDWLGQIPEHWERRKVVHFFKAIKGKRASLLTKEYCGEIEGIYPVFSGQTGDDGIMSLINEYEFDYDKRGCLLVTTVGAKAMSVRYLKGKFSLSQNCMILVGFKDNIFNKFYYYYFSRMFNYKRKLIPEHMQASFRIEDFYNYYFLLPPLAEQEKIATYLDEKTTKIDQAIRQKQHLIQLLKERKQVIIQNTVTKGIKNKGVKTKPSGVEWIGDIPQHWEVKRLKYFFNFYKGLTITKENLQTNGIPCINYGEIHSKYGFKINPEINSLKCVSEDYFNTNKNSLISNGDFIFADTSEDIEGSGNFTRLESKKDIFAGYHTIILKTKRILNTEYFAYLFDSLGFRNQIRTKVKGVKVYSITQSILKESLIVIPTLAEQKEIVSYLNKTLEKIEKAVSLQEQQIALLQEYKTSLINSVVTGKVCVE